MASDNHNAMHHEADFYGRVELIVFRLGCLTPFDPSNLDPQLRTRFWGGIKRVENSEWGQCSTPKGVKQPSRFTDPFNLDDVIARQCFSVLDESGESRLQDMVEETRDAPINIVAT